MPQIMRGQKMTISKFPEPKKLPDGSVPYLQIDQTPALKHNLNSHGWPANNIQEYVNSESAQLQQMLLEKMGSNLALNDPDVNLSDFQKAALCIPRSAQTYSEFLHFAERNDALRASFASEQNRSDEKSEDSSDDNKDSDENKTNV